MKACISARRTYEQALRSGVDTTAEVPARYRAAWGDRHPRRPAHAVVRLAVALALAAGVAQADAFPYESEREVAERLVADLGSPYEASRLAAAESLLRMLRAPGVAGVAAADAAEDRLAQRAMGPAGGRTGAATSVVESDMHSALARRLAYGASGSATPLALVLDDDAEDVEVDLATGRWYRIAVPSAGRLASRSAECPAVWAAYRPGATGDRPTRLPYTRLSTITETFFPSAGEYLIRIDAFSDCDGLRFATEWTGGVTFAGAPPKDAPLERNGASVSTVQLNAGQSAWFTLTLTGQEIVTVSTTRLRPGSDTVVEVYRRGETRPVVADDDNGPGEGASRASLMALAPGAYVVRVGDLHGGKGAFDVTFEAVAVTRAQPGSRAGAVPEEGSVWLTLRGRAGRSYRLFTSELGPDVDTVVSVYRRSDGEMVAENDDGSERDLASDLTWEVTEDGEYLVEISGEMGRPGRFRYTIEEAAIPVARCTQPQEAERAVDAASFDGAVAPSGQSDLVLVEFGADWCAACRRLQPLLRRIAAEYCDHVRLVTVNVDEQSELAARFEVDGIPVVLLYADGRLVDRFSGVPSAAELRAFIRQNLPPAERRVST